MRSWLVIEKLPLIFFRFPFQRKLHGQSQAKQVGWESDEEEKEDD